MSKFFLFSLYYTSFSPLWLSILFINIKSYLENTEYITTEKYSVITIVVLWLITSVFMFISLSSHDKEGADEVDLVNVREEKSITSEYLLSYILPLFAFDFTRWDSFILFLIFFLTLGYLCLKHNYFSVNIVLEIFKYQFYFCEVENSDKIISHTFIISRENLSIKKGEKVFLKSLNNEFKQHIN